MFQTILIDQIKEAFDQFNKVISNEMNSLDGYICVFFSKGQKYLYNNLTTTIKENQNNVITKEFHVC